MSQFDIANENGRLAIESADNGNVLSREWSEEGDSRLVRETLVVACFLKGLDRSVTASPFACGLKRFTGEARDLQCI